MKKLLLFFLFSGMSSLICAQQNEEKALITEDQAISIARQFAIDHEFASAEWFGEDSMATFDEKEWRVFFLPQADERGLISLDVHLTIYLSPYGEVLYPSTP